MHFHGNLTGRCGGQEAVTNLSKFLEHSTSHGFTWLSYRLASQLRLFGSPTIYTCPNELDDDTVKVVKDTISRFDAQKAADCWVRTENLLGDLKICLDMYVARRGRSSINLDGLNVWNGSAPKENDYAHKQCDDLFSEEEARIVWGLEKGVAEQLGYTGCCQGLEKSVF